MGTRTRFAQLISLLMCITLLAARGEDAAALEGKPAPQVNLTTLDGKSFRLGDLRGSVVVLDFWATWCGPCRESLPHLQKLSADKDRFKKGLRVLAVNAGEQQPVVKKFVDENRLTMPIPMDPGRSARTAYRVTALPTTVVIGKDGVVKKVMVGYGPQTSEELDTAIDAALDEQAPKRSPR